MTAAFFGSVATQPAGLPHPTRRLRLVELNVVRHQQLAALHAPGVALDHDPVAEIELIEVQFVFVLPGVDENGPTIVQPKVEQGNLLLT